MVIADQLIQIRVIELRDHAVKKLAAAFTSSFDKFGIVRSDQYDRNNPNVFAGFVQCFSVLVDQLFLACLEGTADFQWFFLDLKLPLDCKKVLTVRDVQRVAALHRTLGERQVVNGIEDIGFAAAVQPHEAVELWAELQAGFVVIFKLD